MRLPRKACFEYERFEQDREAEARCAGPVASNSSSFGARVQ